MSVIPESDELHFGLAASRPSIRELRVFETHETRLLGAPFTFQVIGSSHFVHADRLDFYEIASCKAVEGADVHTLPLSTDLDGEFAFETGDLACSVAVRAADLAAFDADREYDLEYAFGPEAHTAIAIHDGDDGTPADGAHAGYETYHTYPEYDLTVVTRTTLERVR